MSATAIITARLQSSRLPRKVLLPLGRKTILEHILYRLSKAKRLNRLVVASPDDGRQGDIRLVVESFGATWFEGDTNDVVRRLAQAAEKARTEKIVVITGDLPFLAWEGIDEMVAGLNRHYPYGNNIDGVCPYLDGTNAEIITKEGIREQDRICPSDEPLRGHATLWWRSVHPFEKQTFSAPYQTTDLPPLMLDNWGDYFVAEYLNERLKGEMSYDGLIWTMRKYQEDIERILCRYA